MIWVTACWAGADLDQKDWAGKLAAISVILTRNFVREIRMNSMLVPPAWHWAGKTKEHVSESDLPARQSDRRITECKYLLIPTTTDIFNANQSWGM